MVSFHVKFVQTDRRADRWTTVKEYAPPIFRYRGIKKLLRDGGVGGKKDRGEPPHLISPSKRGYNRSE